MKWHDNQSFEESLDRALQYLNEALYHPHSSYDADDDLDFEEVINRDNMLELGWLRPYRSFRVFKATNNIASHVIPGFTTLDREEAELYRGDGDWGGKHLVYFDIERPLHGVTDADMVLDGRDGPIKIEKGAPAVLQRGTEVIILRPEKPLPID